MIIITLLVALLSPALSQAKAAAYTVRCTANIRSQALAFHGYAAESQGQCPFPNWDTMDGVFAGAGWLYKAPMNLALNPVEKNLESGAFWLYNRNYGLYRCPLDRPPYTHGPTQSFTSYIMNGAIDGFDLNRKPWAQLQQFRPDAVMIWEMDEVTLSSGAFNDGATRPSTGATRRHGAGLTVGRADGGAEWITRAYFIEEEARQPGRLWASPFSVNGM